MDAALLFVLAVVMAMLFFLALEVMALVRWRGAWRIAAALPALALLVWIGRIIVDVQRDPTAHNLWPFEIAGLCTLGLAVIAILFVARRLVRPRSP